MSRHGFMKRPSAPVVVLPVLIMSLVLNVLLLIVPLSILLVFDRIIPNQSTETLTLLTLIMMMTVACSVALQILRSKLLGWSAKTAARSNARRFMTKILEANPNQFLSTETAVHQERYRALAALRDYQSNDNQSLRIDLPFVAVFVALIGLIGGILVLVPIAVIVLVYTFSLLLQIKHRVVLHDRKQNEARRSAFLTETFQKIATVKANAMEHQMMRRLENLQKRIAATNTQLLIMSGIARSYGTVIAQASVAAIGLIGAFLVVQEQIGIGEMAACMLLNGRVVQPLMKLINIRIQSETLEIANEKLADVDALETFHTRHEKGPLKGEVTLNNLQATSPKYYMEGVENIAPGDKLLVDAADGSAVSSLFDIFCGVETPSQGSLLIDGQQPGTLVGRRGSGALMRLEDQPAIFTGTLMENLTRFEGPEAVENARSVAIALGLEAKVHQLPMGYNTRMQDAGSFQEDPIIKQLVALVRVLSARPSIILMQDPSSILEASHRKALRDFIAGNMSDVTLVFASHDPKLRSLATHTIKLITAPEMAMAEWDEDKQSDVLNLGPRERVA